MGGKFYPQYNKVLYIDTGSNEAYKVKNIYDLAGNYREVTMRILRAGANTHYNYGLGASDWPTLHRITLGASSSDEGDKGMGSRLQLYIK